MTEPHVAVVGAYLRDLQNRLCAACELSDGGAQFREDQWQRAEGGGGRTRVLADGMVFWRQFLASERRTVAAGGNGASAGTRRIGLDSARRLAGLASEKSLCADDAFERALL